MADIPVVVIFGATAAGKTALLEALFAGSGLRLPYAEVISADSMQVYRGMDIGTAKPSAGLCNVLPHHLIDIRSPNEPFCAGDFVREADICCASIYARGRLPVISGGTGFYIKNFVAGLPNTPESNPETRKALIKRMEKEGISALYKELQRIDPARAAALNPNDGYRILRALEIYFDSGLPQSSFAVPAEKRGGYRFLILSLERERPELYKRIDARCDEMFASGLEREVSALVKAGFTPENPGMRAIGYREFFSLPGCLEKLQKGESLSEDEAAIIKRNIKRNSHRYAKRQETFIKPIPDVIHIKIEDEIQEDASAAEKIAQLIKEFWEGNA